MYESFFGLREAPFALTPNTRYFLRADSHQEALEVLLVALKQGEGFIKVSGEVGTGKTLLCRLLLNHLQDEAVTAYLPNPQLTPGGLYVALADELGVALVDQDNLHRILGQINNFLIQKAAENRSVVLVIDEAQAMPEATMEALRLLTNLETESRKLLQVVLFGQPELDQLLAKQSLRQLKQRISFQCRLQPLNPQAVARYLDFRMSRAGYNGSVVFQPAAVNRIARASGGIPRVINVIAHKALLAAWGRGDRHVGRWHVRQAVKDTESSQRPSWLGWLGWRGRS